LFSRAAGANGASDGSFRVCFRAALFGEHVGGFRGNGAKRRSLSEGGRSDFQEAMPGVPQQAAGRQRSIWAAQSLCSIQGTVGTEYEGGYKHHHSWKGNDAGLRRHPVEERYQ
jgi:hypothetical protein